MEGDLEVMRRTGALENARPDSPAGRPTARERIQSGGSSDDRQRAHSLLRRALANLEGPPRRAACRHHAAETRAPRSGPSANQSRSTLGPALENAMWPTICSPTTATSDKASALASRNESITRGSVSSLKERPANARVVRERMAARSAGDSGRMRTATRARSLKDRSIQPRLPEQIRLGILGRDPNWLTLPDAPES